VRKAGQSRISQVGFVNGEAPPHSEKYDPSHEIVRRTRGNALGSFPLDATRPAPEVMSFLGAPPWGCRAGAEGLVNSGRNGTASMFPLDHMTMKKTVMGEVKLVLGIFIFASGALFLWWWFALDGPENLAHNHFPIRETPHQNPGLSLLLLALSCFGLFAAFSGFRQLLSQSPHKADVLESPARRAVAVFLRGACGYCLLRTCCSRRYALRS